ALYLAWPLLSVMLHSQRAWTFHCPAGSWVGFCQDGTIGIPPSLGGGITMFDVGPQLTDWLGIQPRHTVGSERYIAVGAWALSGLCLLGSRRRGVLLAWLGAGFFLALLGQGPCPAGPGGQPSGWAVRTPGLGAALNWTWCNTSALHDFGRYTTASLVLAAVCSGLGVEALGTRWKRVGRVCGTLLALIVMGQSLSFANARALRADRWEAVPTLESSALIQDLEPGPIAELPFDSHAQLISVLEVPGLQRVNPFGGMEQGPNNLPFIQWLYSLGRGEIPTSTPTAAMRQSSGVRWVLYDPSRCIPPFTGREQACREEIPAALSWVLGEPVLTEGALRLWAVE
ncbi:MAG: hypothetical protein VX519_11935, partial [Myxococcota bacterium]|nr:hypothetical protein [Myxococcota bacterium]